MVYSITDELMVTVPVYHDCLMLCLVSVPRLIGVSAPASRNSGSSAGVSGVDSTGDFICRGPDVVALVVPSVSSRF